MEKSKYSKLHFSLFPAGGVEIASSRIRIYGLESFLSKRGIKSTFGYSIKANVLLFQKKITNENLWQARFAKAMGSLVIYDVDDLGEALWYWVSKKCFAKMLNIADLVTTCSIDQLTHLKSEYGIDCGYVIPNTIDYFPQHSHEMKNNSSKNIKIIWFGNSYNFTLLEKYINTILKMPNIEMCAVVGKDKIDSLSSRYPNVKFETWSLCNFISILQSYDIACLMHDGNSDDTAKGNNRMITAITWGVPAVVSRTPAYEQTAREAGIEYAVFSNDSELVAAIERLRSVEARKKYLNEAQPVIWNLYSPEAVAQQYSDLALTYLYRKKRY